mmetsp:Transcript_97974/g.315252  ORF Transcript_97974/g.315252 Transcript_97974/m.315252 type:complete len:87 (-) Transcript_97974:23-283(-)
MSMHVCSCPPDFHSYLRWMHARELVCLSIFIVGGPCPTIHGFFSVVTALDARSNLLLIGCQALVATRALHKSSLSAALTQQQCVCS